MEKIIIAYVPVVHAGYLRYFESTGAKKIYVIQAKDLPQFPHLAREIRALSVEELSQALLGFGYEVLPFSELVGKEISKETQVHVPDDDVTRNLIIESENVVWGSWFLRWDWTKATARGSVVPEADRVIRKGDPEYGFASEGIRKLLQEAQRSSDWWRQVAAMAVTRDGKCIVAYNKHYPHENAPYMDGDPRDSFKPGEFIEVTSALHAEQAVIAQAARQGIALGGAEFVVTTFPCNLCAPPIVECGAVRLFFTGGYSNLNGQKTLRDHGVEIVYVEI